MNKIYLLTFTILLFTNQLIGQQKKENGTKSFKVGINAGPIYNSLRGGSFAESYDSRINLLSGLSIEFKTHENFSILTNINYEVKSFKTEYRTMVGEFGDFQIVDIEDETKFQYLNIPLLARLYFGFGNEFFVNGGFYYSLLFDVKNEMVNKENGENYSSLDFNELFKQNDIGFSLGIGINFEINNKSSLLVELRNDLGFSDIGKFDFAGISPTNTNTIKFIANWNFEL